MYFAYLGHYTVALLVPTFLGVVLWLLSDIDQVSLFHDEGCVL